MIAESASAPTPLDLLRMTDGLLIHQSVCATARLGIADLLKDGPRSAADLAVALAVNEDALYRTLRFLAGQGLFYENEARTFTNSALSEWLRSDVRGSVRSILIYRGSPFYFAPFIDLLYSIETGAPAREKGLGVSGFEQLRRNPEEGRIFDDAMTNITMLCAPSVAAAYDFGQWGSLMDVGGGNGLLLSTIMTVHPGLRGVLADVPEVLDRARRTLCQAGPTGRLQFQPIDFFVGIPLGCRAYLMKNIIHDWDDERALRILLNCRQAVPDDGVLLLVEYCVGAGNTPTVGKALDLVMLALTGGKERTVSEHRELLARAGFSFNQTIPLANDVMIIEARPTPVGSQGGTACGVSACSR
jgi:hypothetical protein